MAGKPTYNELGRKNKQLEKEVIDTKWKISHKISAAGNWIGTLEVCYLEPKPELEAGPFLREAKNLINAVAESIAKIIEREEAEDAIRKHQDHIEALIKKTIVQCQ